MREELTITIQMHSDWHIGTGSGRAKEVDRTVRKDKNGLPIIPGRTLKGVLKDSAEVIAGGLGDSWMEWVSHVFGDSPAENWVEQKGSPRSPRPGSLDVRTAELSDGLRAELAADPSLIPFLYTKRPGVAITKEGVAKDDHLRMEERTRGGLTMLARASLEGSEDSIEKAKALLAAAAAWTERLGGKRRRGAGKCTISIEGMTKEAAADILVSDPGKPPAGAAVTTLESVDSDDISTFRLKLRTKSPLCLTKKVEGNVVQSYDHIPGSMILGAIGQALGDKSAAYWAAVDQGRVRVSFAMPRLCGVRGLPMPFAIESPKGGGRQIRSGFRKKRSADWKQARRGFWAKSGNAWIWDSPKMSVISHNVIEDHYQRPTSKVGGVFTYESIDPGMPYECLVTMPSCFSSDLAGKKLRIGRSKSVEYGEVEILAVELTGDIVEPDETNEVFMQAVSPLLLRDKKTGVWAPTLARLLEELEEKLGVKPCVEENERGPMVELRPIEIQTWNVRGRTSRPSAVGLQPGSCLKLKFDQKVEWSKLKEFERSGLGERLAEGFGEVAFDPEILTLSNEVDAIRAEFGTPQESRSASEATSHKNLLSSLKQERLLQMARLACIGSLSKHAHVKRLIPGAPTASQLGIFRSLIADLPDSQEQLKRWMEGALGHKTKGDQWRETLKVLKELLNDPDGIKEIIFKEPKRSINDAAAHPQDETGADPRNQGSQTRKNEDDRPALPEGVEWISSCSWQAIQIAYDAVLRSIREAKRSKDQVQPNSGDHS